VNRFASKYDQLTRYRIGYRNEDGTYHWGRVWGADLAKAASIAVGQLLEEGKDALAVTAPEASLINVIDATDPTVRPSVTPFLGATLGPNAVVAMDIGGDGNTPLDDLVTATVYNAPVENHLETLRNEGGSATPIEDLELDGAVNRPNEIVLQKGMPPVAAALIRNDAGDTFVAADFSTGMANNVLYIPGLPKGSDYLVVRQKGSDLPLLVFYASGGETIDVRTLKVSGGQYEASEPKPFTLDSSIRLLVTVGEGDQNQVLAIFGNGSRAAILDLDPVAGPKVVQTLESVEDEVFSGAVPVKGGGVVAFVKRPTSWVTTMVQVWKPEGGKYVGSASQEITTLDDSVYLIEPLLKANAEPASAAAMKAYTNTIPGTKVRYAMTPIPGGKFLMGTPEAEENRQDNEGPQVTVKVDPFWMQTTEVTWDMYTLFMYSDEERKFKDSIPTEPEFDHAADAVARPSKPYTEMSFGMGKDGFPAIAMTHYAANKFCQWLSAKTGHYYRLPTEAEWEYACRAGTTTAYHGGDGEDSLEDYAWYEMNSDFVYHKVGTKKPNPWGLYDMHGNVMEWCVEGFTEDHSARADAVNPWHRPTKPYPHVARGGSYDDPADWLRSGARQPSDRSWKMTDPQLPKSVWWLSDNKRIGFRIVRPVTVPEPEELAKWWNSGTERD